MFFQLSVFIKQWASYIAIISTILYPSYNDCALLYAYIGVRLQAQLILVLKLKVQSWVINLLKLNIIVYVVYSHEDSPSYA